MAGKLNNRKLKILITADAIGGVWTFISELVMGLSDSADFIIAVMGSPPDDSLEKKFNHLSNVIIYQSGYKLEWMQDPWDDIDEAGKWLLELKEKHKPDLVHLNGYSHGALKWNIPLIITAHSCVLSWWESVKKTSIPSYWNEYIERITEGLKSADLITAPSAAMMKFIKQNYGPFYKTKVIHNGLNKKDYYRSPKEDFIFAMGRLWDEAKNIKAIEDISPLLEWPLLLAGEKENPAEANKGIILKSKHLGILPRKMISFYLSYASIFVHPAKYEPFGYSPLEAALSGCAMVLGDIDSLREIWEDSALYVDPDNEELLADAINSLITDKSLRLSYSEKAYRHAKKYSSILMCNDYLDSYKNLLSSNKNFGKELIAAK